MHSFSLVSALSCFLSYTHKSSQNADTIDDYTSIKSTDTPAKNILGRFCRCDLKRWLFHDWISVKF